MKIHYLQHVPFEGPAYIQAWAEARGFPVTGTRLYSREKPPAVEQYDCLIIMGGPMNIYEEGQYPWLIEEKKHIEEAVIKGKSVLGICLGAQLIAQVLGARVVKNPVKEIGWFPVTLTPEGQGSRLFKDFPESFTAFHWHGDTFNIPHGAVWAAESMGCINQAFFYGEKVAALQFHLESTRDSVKNLIINCREEIVTGRFIQGEEEMLHRKDDFTYINLLMNKLLESMLLLG